MSYSEADEIILLTAPVRINLNILKWDKEYILTPLQMLVWLLWHSCNSVRSGYIFSVLFGISLVPTSMEFLLWLVVVQMIIKLDI